MVKAAWMSTGPGQVSCKAAQLLAEAGNEGANLRTDGQMGADAPNTQTAPKARKAPKKTVKGIKPTDILNSPLEKLTGWDSPLTEGWTWTQPMGDRLFDVDQVAARWHVPASRSTRLNLWSVGLAALSTGPGEETKNRSFLASLIKKYGERKVSAALGEISTRAVPPADPRAFLRAILRRKWGYLLIN